MSHDNPSDDATRLRIEIDGEVLARIRTPQQLDYLLAPRAGVSVEKLEELCEHPPAELEREAAQLDRFIDHFRAYVADVSAATLGGRTARTVLDPRLFSRDQGWRTFIHALSGAPQLDDRLLVIALRHYQRYLAARRQAVELAWRAAARPEPPRSPRSVARPRGPHPRARPPQARCAV